MRRGRRTHPARSVGDGTAIVLTGDVVGAAPDGEGELLERLDLLGARVVPGVHLGVRCVLSFFVLGAVRFAQQYAPVTNKVSKRLFAAAIPCMFGRPTQRLTLFSRCLVEHRLLTRTYLLPSYP